MNKSALDTTRKIARKPILALIAAGLALASCKTSNLGIDELGTPPNGAPVLSANPSGEVIGQGTTRIALLIPKTAPGNASKAAAEIRNGALLALQDFGQNSIQLVIKDTVGQAATAQEKASEAVGEGASVILGPLFSANVSAASAMTQPAGRPIMAFSSDASVAKRGVYLLSFTPQDDVRRIISYAAAQGRRSVVAFLPRNAYGAVVEGALKQIAGRTGVSIVHIARYERSGPGIEQAARDASLLLETADSIYIPEGGGVPGAIMGSLKRLGVPLQGKQIMGSGGWESVKLGDKNLADAIYPGRDISRFNSFAERYKTAYTTTPGVNAALGYDAVTLSVELLRRHKRKAFSPSIIENSNGFAGINGIFRFRPQGTAERGLAIYQVTNGKGQLLVPAPSSFDFRS